MGGPYYQEGRWLNGRGEEIEDIHAYMKAMGFSEEDIMEELGSFYEKLGQQETEDQKEREHQKALDEAEARDAGYENAREYFLYRFGEASIQPDDED